MTLSILELVLTFLGAGTLGTIFAFIVDIRRQNKTNIHFLINELREELGRQKQENVQMRKEFEELKAKEKESDEEKMRLKEENMKLRLEMEDLRNDYEEAKVIIDELRRKIDILLKK